MQRRRGVRGGIAALVLCLLALAPGVAGAANPANTFVIGWQKYTKTGQGDQYRFMTWRIGSSGGLSGPPVYTDSWAFVPFGSSNYQSGSSIDTATARRMQVTPDGRYLLVMGLASGTWQLRSYRVETTGSLTNLGGPMVGGESFAIAPNGKWVYVVASNAIWRHPLSGGAVGSGTAQPVPPGLTAADYLQHAAVSPNSRYLVYTSYTGYGAYAIDADGGLTHVGTRQTGASGHVSFSPNGSVLTLTGPRGTGVQRAVNFDQNTGAFGSPLGLTRDHANAPYLAGSEALWSLDGKHVVFAGPGGGYYGMGCVYGCSYMTAASLSANGATLNATKTMTFDNGSNDSATALGKYYTPRGSAMSPDGDTIYVLAYGRSNYRSFYHTIESYSFRNGVLARSGSLQVCSDYYDAGNSQTPGRGDNCGGPFEITSTRPSLNITAMTPASAITAQSNYTNQSSWTYDVTFNQAVTGLTRTDFSLEGTASGFAVSSVSGSGTAYTVTVAKSAAAPSEGTVILRLAPNSVSDPQGTTGPAASFADTLVAPAVTYDVTPPTATLTAPASPLNTTTPTYAIAFSEPIRASDLATGDFTTTGTTTTTFTVTSTAPSTGNVTSATVGLTGADSAANGDLVVNLAANAVRDRAGNFGPTTAASATAAVSFAPNNVAPPTVAGTMGTGETLSVGGNTWTGLNPITFAYKWQWSLDGQSNWTDVATGGTGATYKIPTTGGGLHYRVEVTATNPRNSAAPIVSAGRGPATISPVLLMPHSFSNKITTLSIRADGTVDTTTTPENTGVDGARVAVVTPDRRFVYVVAGQSSRVYGFKTDAGGALSPNTLHTVGSTPYAWVGTNYPAGVALNAPVGAAISGDGRYLYVFNRGSSTISQFSIGRNGTLAPLSPATVGTQNNGAWIGTNPAGTHVYTVSNRTTRDNNPNQGRLREYRIEANGQLTSLRGEQAITGDAQMLAFTPDGRFAYTMSYEAGPDPCGFLDWDTCTHPGRWQRFSVVQPSSALPITSNEVGRLNFIQSVDLTHLYWGQVSPDGQTLWMLRKSDGTLIRHRINQDTGALTDRVDYDAGDVAHRMALSPDGSYLYVSASRSGDKIFQYSLSSTGVPSPLATASFSTSGGEAGYYGLGPSFTPLFGVQRFEALPLTSGQTRTNSVDYEIVFTRPVTGLEASDFEIGGSAQGMALSALTDQGDGRWTFTVSKAGSVSGTVEVTLKPNSVTDRLGTTGPSTSSLWTALRTTPTITLDYDPPAVSAFPNTAALTDAGAAGPSTNVQAIEAGYAHFCAIVGAGATSTVKCWGQNTYGELGDGTTQRRTGPVTAVGVAGAVAIDADVYNSCALLGDGTVKCWGYSVLRENGTMGAASTPQTVPGLTGATAISNSNSHFCAIVTGGAIRCWGSNMAGEVGDGTTATPRTAPTAVPGITGATAVEAWGNSTCAILANATVSCWGTRYGQTPASATTPVAVSGLSGVTALEGNNRHICARVGSGSTGSVRCWGELAVDIAGIGRTGNITTPAAVIGVTGAMPTTQNASYCYLEANGTAKCAGINSSGALLNGTTSTAITTPATTATLLAGTPALDLAASANATCALLQLGPVRCAGGNANGELGSQLTGGAQSSTALVTVPGLEDGCSAAGRYQMEFSLTFGASVTGLTCTDIGNVGTSSGWSARIVSGSGSGPYVVQMSTNTLNEGTVIPRLAANSVQGGVSPGPSAPADGATQTLAKPAARSVPTTSGSSATVGGTLTVTPPVFGTGPGEWAGSPAPQLTYQWQVSSDGVTWTNATGANATSTSYAVAAGDAGKRHRAVVTATNLLGTTTEFSRQATSAASPSAPGLVSFERTASSSDTSASTVAFRAVFSHVPQGLTASDFRPTGTATGWSVQSMTGSGVGPYVITLGGTATGAGSLGLQLRADSTTVGHASYPAANPAEADSSYVVTRVPPAVGLFALSDSTATTRTYSIVFDAPIDPATLTASDFSVGGTASGWTVGTPSGSGAGPYTVVLTGSGAGTVIPTLAANAVASPGGTTGPTSAVAGQAGTTATWTEPATPTSTATLAYTVIFSRAVTGFDAADVTPSGTASSSCQVAVNGSGTTYTVTLTLCGANGTVGLRIAANALGSGIPEENVDAATVTRDGAAPTVQSFTAATPSSASAIPYTLTFSEAVTGLTPSDISLSAPSGWSVTSVTPVASATPAGSAYTVLVGGANPTAGVVTPTLAANAVADLAGNAGPAGTSGGTAVTSDRTAPSATGLTPTATHVNGTTITYTLTVDEPVSGLAPGDFQLGGTSTGWAVTAVTPSSGTASSFTVTLTGTNPTAGNVIPTLRQNAVQDAAGNYGPSASFTPPGSNEVAFDATAPTVASFTAAATAVRTGGSATFTITFSEDVTGVAANDFSNGGTAGACTFDPGADTGSTRTVTVSGASCAVTTAGSTIIPTFAPNGARDAALNTGPATAATVPTSTTYDATAPTITGNTLTTPASGATNQGTATFTVGFSEPVVDFAAADITVELDGTATSDWTVTSVTPNADGTAFTVTVTRGASATSGDGAVTIDVAPGGVTDAAGNAGTGSTSTSPTATYDTTAPNTTASVTSGPAAGTQDNDPTPTFAFGGNGGGETHECKVDAGAFATCTSPYTVSPALADGSHTLTVRTSDAAGNGSATETTRTWTVDTAPPVAPTIGNAVTTPPYPETSSTSRTISFVPDGAVEVVAGIPFSSTTQTTASIDYQAPPGTTPRCKVDGGAWATCPADPLALTGLAAGPHTVLFDSGAGTLISEVTWTVVGSGGVDTRNPVDYLLADGTTSATQCRIGNGAFADCGSPATFTGLGTGEHTATVSARDAAGNTSTSTTSWTVDTTPPAETPALTGGPAGGAASSDATPTFSFPSAPGLATECRVDGGAWAACASPHTIAPASAPQVTSGLLNLLTFDDDALITVDKPTTSGLACAIDGTAFPTPDECNPMALTDLAPGSHTARWTWNDGTATYQTEVTWTVVTALPVSSSPATIVYTPDRGVADGSHTFEVRYVDPAGNGGTPVSRTWTTDTAAPSPPTIGSGPASSSSDDDPTPAFAFSGAGPNETYECKVDAGAWAACTSPFTAPTLGDGSHTFSNRTVDAAGNASTPTTRTWTVDTVAPTTTGTATRTSPASSPTTSTSASIGLAGAGAGETYECSLDGGAWAACTDPFSATGLADGEHTLRVRTVDAAGNVGALGGGATVSWKVDTSVPTSAPAPSGLPTGGTSSTTATGTLPTPSTGSTIECNRDSLGWGPCPTPLQYAGLADGVHTLETREKDAAGNYGPVTTTTWTVDTAPPNPPSTGAGPSTTTDTTPTVTFTGDPNDPAATFQCSLDSGPWTTCTSPYAPPAGLSPGAHTVDVRQVDSGGNPSATPTRTSFTVDPAAPAEVVVTGTPTSPSSSDVASLSFALSSGSGTIRCEVDGGVMQDPCPSPLALSGLAEGVHVVIFETGTSPNVVETSVRWLVDRTSPSAPVIGRQPANPTNATTAAFSFSGDPGVTFECRMGLSGSWAACTSPHEVTGLTAGSPTFEVRAKDAAGNRSAPTALNWTIDTTPPTGTAVFTQKPSATTTAQTADFAFTLGADGASAQCSTDGTTWTACTSPQQLTGLAEGPHTFHVRILDAAGNPSTTPTTYTWTVDTGPPTGTPSFSSQPPTASSDSRGTFQFTGATAPETYECQVDAGAWIACASPYTTPALADGAHTFRVRIVDPAGNVGANVGAATWTVDTVAPTAPTVTGGSTGTVGSGTGTLEFAAPPSGSTAQCRVDEGTWAACTSPKAFTGLTDGYHTAEVRFVDAAGNVGTAASRSWTSDTTPPAVVPVITTQVPSSTSETSLIIGARTAVDRGETVECKLDGGAWTACNLPYTTPALADGSHTFAVRIVDAAGNATDPATATWTVDTAAPAAPTVSSGVSQGGTAGPAPTINVPTQPGETVECRVNSDVSSPLAFGPCPVPYTVSPPLPAGSNTIEFRVVDAAGNVGSTTTVSFTVDATPPPAPAIASGPTGTVASVAATFSFTSSEAGATFLCSLDGGPYAACSSPKAYANVGADGAHTFSVKAVDAYGNQGTATTRTWTVDTTGPQTPPTITGAPTGVSTSSEASLTVTTNEAGATLECSVNGAAFVACSSPVPLTGLSDGTQTILIRQVDALGNPGAAATVTWSIDTIGPVAAPTVTGVPTGVTDETSYTAVFTGAGAGETYQCSTDGGASWATCSSPYAQSGLENGTHRLAVRIIDGPGNPSPTRSLLWVIETGPPTTPPTSGGVPPATTSPAPSFTFAGGTTSTFECSLDGGATWTTCTSPYTPPANLPPGAHSFQVREVNGSGTGPVSSTTFVVDPAAPPEVAVGGTPSSPTKSDSANLTLTVESGATLYCSIDGAAAAACASAVAPLPMPAAGDPVPYALPLSGLGEGTHSVAVYQIDANGQQSSTTTVVWRVDTVAPVPPAISGQPDRYTSSTSAQFTFAAEPGTTSECSVDGGNFAPCTSPVSLTGLADGDHSLAVRSVDGAGNIGSQTDPVPFTVDRTPPSGAPVVTASPDAVSTRSVETIAFTLPGGPLEAASAQCSLDGGAWTTCTPPHQVAGISVGEHTLRIRLVDAAGNVGANAASVTWERIVPTTPPSGSPGITINGGAEFATSTSVIVDIVWPSGAWYVELSNDPSFAGAQRDAISTAAAWTLASASGVNTVYARFLDQGLNPVGAASYSDSVTIDAIAPVVSALAFARAAGGVDVTPTVVDEGGSGLASWQATTSTAAPGADIPAATPTAFVSMRRNGAVYVRAVDRAGNTSAWFSDTPKSDDASGSVLIAEHVRTGTAGRVDEGGTARIPIACTEGGGTCAIVASFRVAGREITKVRLRVREGRETSMTAKLDPATQLLLATRGRLVVQVMVAAQTSAGRETREVSVTLTAPLATSARLLAGKRATRRVAYVLARCAGSAPQHCSGVVTLRSARKVRSGGKRRFLVLGSGKVVGAAGTDVMVAIKLNKRARMQLRRTAFLPVRATWRLPSQVKPRRGRVVYLRSRVFQVPTRMRRVGPFLVQRTMLSADWRSAGSTAAVGTILGAGTKAEVDRAKLGLWRFKHTTFSQGPGRWLTSEAYLYRTSKAAEAGFQAIVAIARKRGPLETRGAAEVSLIPIEGVNGKVIVVAGTSAFGPDEFTFWCWRQGALVACNRAPSATADVLPGVTAQQVPMIARLLFG